MSSTVEAFLNQLHHPMLATIDLSLDRMHRLLSILGSPQRRLPPVVHVAGTNGKGSLLAYLQAIFEAAGYRVHRYSSPHLVHFHERIILQGREIEDRVLEHILRYIAPVIAQQPATFFEATTAAAFLAFNEKPADILLLETGLGGRLDATNVIEKPLVTAITPVSFDHCEYLGKTLEAIAAEKAGILKQGVPCVVGRQEPAVTAVIEARAAQLASPLYRMGQQWRQENGQYISAQRTLALHPSLAGAHQLDNAATAVACVEQLSQFTITDEHIAQGLAAATWPARLQRLSKGRYPQMLPAGVELWLDGGHNPQGGQVLAEWLKEQQGKDIYLICGMTRNKDTKAYLAHLAPHVKALCGIAIPGEATSLAPEQMQALAQELGIEAYAAPSVEKALQSMGSRVKTPAIVCICGSLYLAGKILAGNGNE